MSATGSNSVTKTVRHGRHLAAIPALLMAIAAAAIMAVSHLVGISVPGCGSGSGCDQAASSVWGRIPIPFLGAHWPVSFIGLAWFAALLTAWLTARDRLPRSILWPIRFGALASVWLIGVMLIGGYVCPYCLAAHAGNLVFWVVAERSAVAPAASRRSWMVLIMTLIVVAAGLEVAAWRVRAAAFQKAEQRRRESASQIIGRTDATAGESAYGPDHPFTGRWRIGPEVAPIRIVIFSDYQCTDCKTIEMELRQLRGRPNLSVSVKHFPFCRPCNENVDNDLHPNACWAARAAETAGLLRGADGFWAMHDWLFDRGGSFTDAELNVHLAETGYDAQQFTQLMMSDETLQRVRTDVAEGMELGLHFTPMIFINGRELKGWNVPRALTRTVDEVAATNPPAQSTALDRPPTALQKYVDDWRQQPATNLPADLTPWTIGPESARVSIVMWGDFQEPFTADADRLIRAIASRSGNVRYHFRHFPVDQSCNPSAPRTLHDSACLAAQAAEAAGRLGGADAYWAMHAWLMDHQDDFTNAPLLRAAVDLGLDPDSLLAAISAPDINNPIVEDAQAAQQLGVRTIPLIYVNKRFVPRWHLEGSDILERIVEEAAAGK